MIFIRAINKNKLETLIIAKKETNCTFICAIGYGGRGVFEEFCGKFYWDDQANGIRGLCSDTHDPDEWERKILDEEITDNMIRTIEKYDKKIINNLVKQIWDEYLTFDEKTQTRLIRSKYLTKTNVYKSEDWFPDIIDLVSNYHWGLLETFDY